MIDVKCDKGAVSISIGGTRAEILADFAVTISNVFNQLYLANPTVAKQFKDAFIYTFREDGLVWTVDDIPADPGAVTCIIPVKKKKGVPDND